ncbi:hypothetical protein BDZ94DRAFT_1269036 [Collybia nuda]|uniref:Uncharacterized protein n=1 Tax=Collybia nuda TaxID=64659 RepID=A0A9P5XYP0_9AGAR|nr:hypothetical protein BDZ94DRAFT_1269036 [Collybia nuda]
MNPRDVNPPTSYSDAGNQKLGTWVSSTLSCRLRIPKSNFTPSPVCPWSLRRKRVSKAEREYIMISCEAIQPL